jgi:hypothetical protein
VTTIAAINEAREIPSRSTAKFGGRLDKAIASVFSRFSWKRDRENATLLNVTLQVEIKRRSGLIKTCEIPDMGRLSREFDRDSLSLYCPPPSRTAVCGG